MSPTNSKRPAKSAIAALVVSFAALVAASLVMFNSPERKPKDLAKESGEPVGSAETLKDGYVMIGGVARPKTDLKANASGGSDAQAGKEEGNHEQWADYGETPYVPEDANVYVKSVVEAFKTGKHPERISSMAQSRPFDAEAYQQDPSDYLETIEPGRVFQPAQPGPGVPRLDYTARPAVEVTQGESVPLQVKAVPNAPVTFTSFDLGRFKESLLTSVTVQANDQGVATAKFEATPGTIGHVDVLAASPMTSGQLRFMVNVTLPKPAGVSAEN